MCLICEVIGFKLTAEREKKNAQWTFEKKKVITSHNLSPGKKMRCSHSRTNSPLPRLAPSPPMYRSSHTCLGVWLLCVALARLKPCASVHQIHRRADGNKDTNKDLLINVNINADRDPRRALLDLSADILVACFQRDQNLLAWGKKERGCPPKENMRTDEDR